MKINFHISFLLHYHYINNNIIPSIWYINSILEYLDKIPQDYIENDYKKLFEELFQKLNDSINELDFEKLILFRNKLKFVDKMNDYFDSLRQTINDIRFNKSIKNLIENTPIPINITLNFNEKGNKFELTPSSIKEKSFENKIIVENPKKNLTSFKSIEAFTRYFPNLSQFGKSPIDIIKEYNIKEKFDNYFKIIEEKLSVKSQQTIPIYMDKIKDYIMNKIYDKIYPSKLSNKDIKIYNKSLSLSWVDPNYLLKKNYNFDNMLPDILNEFNQIHIKKNPYKKLLCLRNIMKSIDILIKFNEGMEKEIGAEDITPVLN